LGVRSWPIVSDGKIVGMIDAASAVAETGGVLYPDQPLSVALEKMGSAHVDVLPVVSRADMRKILGVVTMPDVLAAYGVKC
jgi:CBS domain-containing protein